MKKCLLFIVLSLLQAACSSQPGVVSDNQALLSFSDLANEITVAYEDMVGREPVLPTDEELLETP